MSFERFQNKPKYVPQKLFTSMTFSGGLLNTTMFLRVSIDERCGSLRYRVYTDTYLHNNWLWLDREISLIQSSLSRRR